MTKDEELTLEALNKKVVEGFSGLHDRLTRFFRKALIAFVVLGLACTAAVAGCVLLFREIQNQRYDVTYQNCLDQNERHDKTLTKFLTVFPPQNEKQEKNLRVFVDTLLPKVDDCQAQANARVKGPR